MCITAPHLHSSRAAHHRAQTVKQTPSTQLTSPAAAAAAAAAAAVPPATSAGSAARAAAGTTAAALTPATAQHLQHCRRGAVLPLTGASASSWGWAVSAAAPETRGLLWRVPRARPCRTRTCRSCSGGCPSTRRRRLPTPRPTGGTMLVLYVDSSPIDQAVASVLLDNEPGLRLVSVSSGAEALEVVFSGQWLPDLVLMDVLLQDMAASEVCRQVRCAFGSLELPIVLLSSRSGEAGMLAALERGVNDFLIKPLRRIELLARVNSQVMIKQSLRREAESRSHYELLVQVLPPHIIERLAAGQAYIPEQHEQVTILFSDIVGFTELCSLWPTQQVVAMLDMLFSAFDDLCDKHGVFKVETVGDAYMAVAGHDGSSDHTLRVAAMAVDMLAAAADVQQQILAKGSDGWRVQIRIGMHRWAAPVRLYCTLLT
ncbi:hypothetical protein COO60DRAFT_286934 [Scenedesmus sp. NREL 46B-D3]|nr:hypothetical protein COO60DRAFT_286934 [Scenedesmus sp. NREL 46B-D3]